MQRVMFDTNIFDAIRKSECDLERILASSKYVYYISSIQKKEIDVMPDTKSREKLQNFLIVCELKTQQLHTPAVVDYSRANDSIVTKKEDAYNSLITTNPNDNEDAIIGSIAEREGCIVVTDDTDFTKRLKHNNIPCMSYAEFIESL